jgi:hypothetical protein
MEVIGRLSQEGRPSFATIQVASKDYMLKDHFRRDSFA